MAALSSMASHLLLLMFNCFLGAASVGVTKGGARDGGFPPSSSGPFSDDQDQDMVSQHMSKLYERYNRENHLKEGNTVRSVRASQGV